MNVFERDERRLFTVLIHDFNTLYDIVNQLGNYELKS